MTLQELVEELTSYVLLLPAAKDQQIYNISIRSDATVAISLESTTIYVELFKVRPAVD